MTFAPAKLLETREYLKPLTGLSNVAMGITSDGPGHGYHRGKDAIDESDDYSVTESTRDRDGLTNAASALDIGLFSRTVNRRAVTLRSLTLWLVEQCKANTADTKDIREIIYTPDGNVVRRWDRLGIRSSGDDSHLTHTHISWFRDAEFRDHTAVFRRYFEGDDLMGSADDILREVAELRTMLQQHHLQNQGDNARGGSLSGVKYGVKQQRVELAAVLAAASGNNAEEILTSVRAELAAYAERERAERAAELAALSEQFRTALSDELGAETGERAAQIFAEIVARGATPQG